MTKVRAWFNLFKKRFFLFLVVLGPGIITAVADNDAGGVATYTVAASIYGMASQFLIIPETILLAITQEIGARIAIASGRGLGDLIREYYGVRISVLIFILYFITNQGVVLQNMTGLKAAFQLFNLPWRFFLILVSLTLIYFVIKFNYTRLQKIFLLMLFFYFSYVASAFLAHPNWKEAVQESLIFPTKIDIKDLTFWFSRIAVLGTTITAWGQFFIQSYIIDKKLSVEHLKTEQLEVVIGSFITRFFSWMMAVAVTYTLFVNHLRVTDGFSAALAIKPFAGEIATALFSVGLFGASILGLTIVPLATAYVFSEMFGYEGSLDSSWKKGRLFYGFFGLQIVLGLIISLFPQISLFKLTLIADFLNGAMLPIIFFFLIKFSENKEIMGRYRSKLSTLFVRLAAVLITIAVVITFLTPLE